MTKISDARIFGGVGSILALLTAVPTIGSILGVIGLVLTLIAVKYISDGVGDSHIFTNMLISVILGIVSLVVAAVLIFGGLMAFFGIGGLAGLSAGVTPNINQGNIGGLLLAIIPGLLAFWIMMIISAHYLRKSYHSASIHLNVGIFDTAALIYFIGAILTIVLIGLVLILVADILFIVAYFSIDETRVTQKPVQTV